MPASLPEQKRKRPANLSLSAERLQFGQRFARAHQTSLSQVVEDLLGALEGSVPSGSIASSSDDPLDGMLAGWPELDKKALRKEQHERRLAR